MKKIIKALLILAVLITIPALSPNPKAQNKYPELAKMADSTLYVHRDSTIYVDSTGGIKERFQIYMWELDSVAKQVIKEMEDKVEERN